MTGRALTVLAIVVIFGAAIGVYLIKGMPIAQNEDAQVRSFVEAFGMQLQKVSLLADRTMVADAMQEHYAPYVAPALLTRWQNDPTKAPGRRTSSPWPERIEITSIEKRDAAFEVQGYVIEVTNEGGGIGEVSAEAARRPIMLTVEKAGNEWRVRDSSLGAYPGDGEWTYSEPDAQGIQFNYPESLPTTYVSAQEWPPIVRLVSEDYACDEGERESPDGLQVKYEKRTVEDREYCAASQREGVAGSRYVTYEYTAAQGDFVAHVAFVLRFPQCMNYDEPQQTVCTNEQADFDIDGLVDRIASSIRML